MDLGADGIELDIHQTRDNEIVVIHDDRLERTSNGTGWVKDYTLEQLRQFDFSKMTNEGVLLSVMKESALSQAVRDSAIAKAVKKDVLPGEAKDGVLSQETAFGARPARIPTMQEVFELIRPTGLTINIELKTNVFPYPGIEKQIVEMTAAYGMRERVWYSSFNRVSIEKIHLLDPDAKVGFLYGETSKGMPILARSLGMQALHPSFPNVLNPQFLEECRSSSLLLNVWTIDTAEQMLACRKAGVHAVITNFPDLAKEIMTQEI